MRRFIVLAAFLCVFSVAPAVQSQNAPVGGKTLKVVTRILPPFVFEENGQLTGFSVELWQAIAGEMKAKFEWRQENSIADVLSGVQAGKADLGVSAISITASRAATFDFSQPVYDGGLQILIKSQKERDNSAFYSYFRNFFTPSVLSLLGTMLLLILVAAHLIWLLERNAAANGLIETRRYFPGIFKAFWWAAATLGAQADEMPRTYAARMVAVLWMFISIFFVAYFTAQMTSELTVKRLSGTIHGPDDLPGKTVATTIGSTAEAYLKANKSRVKTVAKIEDAYTALETGEVEAVVFDSPVLLYYAAHDGKGKADIVGPIFKREDYGIISPNGSPLRRPIDEALLRLRENGTYDAIYNKWFQDKDGAGS